MASSVLLGWSSAEMRGTTRLSTVRSMGAEPARKREYAQSDPIAPPGLPDPNHRHQRSRFVARSESAAVQAAAPKSSKSFIRKPCASIDRLGVVNRKLKVITNMMHAPRLPIIDNLGDHRRRARSTPSASSITPSTLDAA